ncbi:class I SAM-dependent methyltransferase [Cryobacterium zhongshanensis]|uniref:Class I SAM-dependent methyltransferase n=1 Tax=Cryobacterium zhongshanensis TaxID=2928153 RepID=A0AA41QX13_9MICO|nr:class I SAM-dependent methyltransferase [Cryobacterium zhongshanensis]MCI4658890.1 class I SAM-dependent methyltransferase [Cryobacterium zhongshanensis]
MVHDVSRTAYSRRAAEYIELLGSMTAVHPSDLHLVSTWANEVDGEIIDAGCGPGQWTDFLARHGNAVRGIDVVPEFIAHARHTYPDVNFTLGSFDCLDADTGSVGGVLAWYSLIHHEPETIQAPLLEISRALKPGGTLLVGFFEGPLVDEFAHAVTAAFRWPVERLGAHLRAAGFDVVESHVRKTTGQRSHAAILARRRGATLERIES